tara:strand:+ start:9350 stop:10117 length:768 start_codon:yes stop_codon:yes gene_type:complete
MQIIPAIDLLDGMCVRLNQGNYNMVTQFNSDPVEQAIKWQSNGAKRIHIVDLDAAKTGKPINDKKIKQITKAIDIPIQIGGGIRGEERVEELLSYGIERVILGTIAIEKPNLVKDLTNKFPGRIIVGIDAKAGKVATRGWMTQSQTNANDLARSLSSLNLAAIISTDISTDGTLKGPNLNALKEIAIQTQIPIIASGGVGSISDLLALTSLESYGIIGVIVGRALYDGTIDLQEAIKALEKPRIEDVPLVKDYLA